VRQDEIRALEKSLQDKERELIPKKKFGFRSKTTEVQKPEKIVLETSKIPELDADVRPLI